MNSSERKVMALLINILIITAVTACSLVAQSYATSGLTKCVIITVQALLLLGSTVWFVNKLNKINDED